MRQLTTEIHDAVRQASERRQLPVQLLYAICVVESVNDPAAWKVEPPYRYLVDARTGKPFRALTAEESRSETAPADFPVLAGLSSRDTEWWGQQASWGPMQIMGAVAREARFVGHFPELCGTPGIVYGCLHLAALRTRFLARHGWEGVVAAYNAGSPRRRTDATWENQAYVDKVRAAGGLKF